MSTKTCPKCKEEKNIEEGFHFQNKKKNIRMSWCKNCSYKLKLNKYKKKEESGLLSRISTITARELKEHNLKRCPTCKLVKSLEKFCTSKNSNGGYSSHCKECSKHLTKKITPQQRKKYYSRSKEKVRNYNLIKKYGITLEEYNIMLKKQNNVCAICGCKDKKKSLAVDHDHKTKKIRGLLCSRCNPALGFIQESPKLIKELLKYLNFYKNGGVPSDTDI
jgi:hypothetical protein